MKRNIFVMMSGLVLTIAGLFVACDNDENEDIEIVVEPVDSIAEVNILDSIISDYCLLNEKGKDTTGFSYGENITFRLMLHNISSQTVSLPNETIVLGKDAFRVYSVEEQELGRAYDDFYTYAAFFPCVIAPGFARSWICKWNDPPYYTSEGTNVPEEQTQTIKQFWQEQEKPNLPTGQYYSQFYLDFGSNYKRLVRKVFYVR